MKICLENVSKNYGKQKILADINLSMQENEIFGLIGPSGSGKTTLIRLMTGAISSDSGTVYLGRQKMPNLEALEWIGYMPQNDALYLDLSGRDNLRFFGAMMGMKKAVLEDRIDEVLALVSLEHDEKKCVQNYSGGMKKRLSLATALLHKPKILFLDEPTVGIDPILRKKIWD
ncbi:MAG: ABC transporter ATP-binding protein [Velocimicrobium sp.]